MKKTAAATKTPKKKPAAAKSATGKTEAATKPAAVKRPTPAKRPAPAKEVRPASTPTARRKPRAGAGLFVGPMHGFEPYQPGKSEGYMSAKQLEHFRQILLTWKRQLMEEVDRTVHHMQDEAANFPDPNDRATQESEFSLELRTRDRERKLLRKIDSALQRIDDGEYGYCEETGEEIGLRRLEARPVATLCLEAQERRELAERQYGERDDRYR